MRVCTVRILSQLSYRTSLSEDTDMNFSDTEVVKGVRNDTQREGSVFLRTSMSRTHQEDTMACSHVSLVSGTPMSTKSLLISTRLTPI